MDDEDLKQGLDQQEQNQDEQSPSDQTGNVTGKIKDVGQRAFNAAKGAMATPEEAGAEAAGAAGETGAGGAAAGATSGEGAGATGAAGTTSAAAAGATVAEEAGAAAAGAEAVASGSTALEASTVLSTSSLSTGGPIIALFVVILVLVFGIVFLQGGSNVNAGTPSETPPPISTEPPTCDQVDASLTSLNTQTEGVTDCGRKQLLYTTVATMLSYSRFKTLIGDRPIVFFAGDDGSTCYGDPAFWGCTKNSGKVLLKNFNDPQDSTPWQYVITHEMFHVLALRNPSVISIYRGLNNSFIQKEPGCYRINATSSVIKTYDLDTKGVGESFAESGALYILGSRKSISNFQTQCPNNFDFWKQTIGEKSQPPINQPHGEGEGTGQLVTFQIGNHSITTNYRSSNSCPGKFYGNRQIDLTNINKYPIGNFGDPNCDFSKDAVINLIKQLDPGEFVAKNGRHYQKYAVWDGIIHCESGYFPNALNRNSRSGWGAWGLFQMNPDFSGRAVHDNGTTDWRTQVENAITRNHNTGEGFGYWGCAGGFRRGTKDPRI